MAIVQRAVLGFLAAVVSVLTFHQGMWWLLHLDGLMPPPYPMMPTQPLGVPLIASLCFWGGLYGALFGIALPRLAPPRWLWGLGLGVLAGLVGFVIVAPLKGRPIDFAGMAVLRSLLINGFWGIGVGLIAPTLIGRRPAMVG